MTYGQLHEKNSLFFRVDVGDATDPKTGVKYELSLSGGTTPLVRSSKSGQWFLLSWADIISLAVKAGIDKDE